jgi:TRAP-type mannitol/chloroaromatic compound transport system permease small subunit
MPKFILYYVRYVDKVNRTVGRGVLYLVFAIMGILIFSSLSRYIFDKPVIWGVEMAQFTMTIYFTLGGAFALLLNSHVRMDLLYSRWGKRRKARMDAFTFFFLICYLCLLMYGCVSSTLYSIEYNQHNNTAWAPPVAPVKIIVGIGIFLTILQAFSEFFKDLARGKNLEIGVPIPETLLLDEAQAERSAREIVPAAPGARPISIPVPAMVHGPAPIPVPAAAYDHIPVL